MRRRLPLALCAALTAPLPAAAQDSEGGPLWRLDLSFGLSVQDNAALDPDGASRRQRASAGALLHFEDVTRQDRLSFDLGLESAQESGPGATEKGTRLSPPRFDLSWQRQGANAALGLHLAQEESDLGRTIGAFDLGRGQRRDRSGEVTFEVGTKAPVGLALRAGHKETRYSGAAAALNANSKSDELSADLHLRLSGDRQITLSAGQRRFREAGAAQRRSDSLGLRYEAALPNGSWALALGQEATPEGHREKLSATRRFDRPLGALELTLGAVRGVDGQTHATGALLWEAAHPRGAWRLRLSRDVAPNARDRETAQSTAALSYTHALSPRDSLTLAADFATEGRGSARQSQSALSASWAYALSPDWSLDLGLTHRRESRAGARAQDNLVSLQIGRSFLWRP